MAELEEIKDGDGVATREFKRLRNMIALQSEKIEEQNKIIAKAITKESLQTIIDYINEGEPDISVVASEIGEIILRHTGEYSTQQTNEKL